MELIAGLSQVADLVEAPENQGSMLVADPAVFARLHRRLSEAERKALAGAYREGATLKGLAEQFEISRTTVLKVLDEQGESRRYRKFGPDDLQEARRLYESGWSFARVGAEMGVDPKTVHTAFRRAGIPSRPQAGR